jgi:NAD-specific glutamate dehydrogenase
MRKEASADEPSTAAESVMQERSRDVERIRKLLDEVQAEEELSLAGVSVAVRELAVLADRMDS